jgi:flagellar motor switch protein FliN/FliY
MSKQMDSSDAGLGLVMDMEVPITVRFGAKQMIFEEILKLDQGALVELDRSAEDPVEVFVNGKAFAKGEVVVVDGCYAVRITEVLNPPDKVQPATS